MVFCGSFEAKGLAVEYREGRARITPPGRGAEDRAPGVRHVTFGGQRARAEGQKVVYVTERGVFELCPKGLTLIEVADGVDLRRDVIDRLPFDVRLGRSLAPPR